MLETLRALRASGTPLRNDVIFLFTDGEENGLLGAHAFIDEHRWAKDVGLALNFEARGNSGPSIMFETSDENGWLIKEFAKAAPHPMANSLAYEIDKLLPNDTDFTVVKQAGLPGFNFAYIEGVSHYHTMLDRFEQFDERSLQHHGSYALALTRHFSDLNLIDRKEANAVYFDILGLILIHYPSTWVTPLSIFAFFSFAALVAFGFAYFRFPLRNVLFAEKMSGTVHLALGDGFPQLGSRNRSGLHWDLVCDLRDGGELWADGEPVQRDGAWLI